MTTVRSIVPPAHRPLARGLRRSWGTPRRARDLPMDRWDDLQTLPPVLTRRIISSTHNPVSRVRLCK